MKLLILLPFSLCFLIPTKIQAQKNHQIRVVCESFATGKIGALKTLEELDLEVEDYSIGINNTAKIFCS
tara:strand:- start:300 stop:506 length:207 start_codon:yes stop_codon:yes gene_type:complete